MRRLLRAVLAPLVGLALVVGLTPFTGAVAAASTYLYWSYWHLPPGATDWTYAETGPTGFRPTNGAVEGWRFGPGQDEAAPPPRYDPAEHGSGEALCPTDDDPATKTITLLLDFGTASEAPAGPAYRCEHVPPDATGADVLLASDVTIRRDVSLGLICALNGYPSSGCAEVVETPSARPEAPTPSPRPLAAAADTGDDGGLPVGALVGGGVVVLLAVGGAWQARRSRSR